MAREFMDVFPGRPFHILITIASNFVVKLAKHQTVAMTYKLSLEIIRYEDNEPSSYSALQSLPDSVDFVHYRPASIRLQQMHQCCTMQ